MALAAPNNTIAPPNAIARFFKVSCVSFVAMKLLYHIKLLMVLEGHRRCYRN
jgi:hypothetical protein